MTDDTEHSGGLYEKLGSHPKLQRGQVWCRQCKHTELINSAGAPIIAWPKCCGHTMTIDAPGEIA